MSDGHLRLSQYLAEDLQESMDQGLGIGLVESGFEEEGAVALLIVLDAEHEVLGEGNVNMPEEGTGATVKFQGDGGVP